MESQTTPTKKPSNYRAIAWGLTFLMVTGLVAWISLQGRSESTIKTDRFGRLYYQTNRTALACDSEEALIGLRRGICMTLPAGTEVKTTSDGANGFRAGVDGWRKVTLAADTYEDRPLFVVASALEYVRIGRDGEPLAGPGVNSSSATPANILPPAESPAELKRMDYAAALARRFKAAYPSLQVRADGIDKVTLTFQGPVSDAKLQREILAKSTSEAARMLEFREILLMEGFNVVKRVKL